MYSVIYSDDNGYRHILECESYVEAIYIQNFLEINTNCSHVKVIFNGQHTQHSNPFSGIKNISQKNFSPTLLTTR